MERLELLKKLFDELLQETQGTVYRMENKEWLKLNAEVFEFQSHVFQGLKASRINLILNPIIESKSIQNSFSQNAKALPPQDYCLPFLDYLNVHKDNKIELVDLINHFIEEHKEEFTWQDVVITATGATRCKTNIRFALNQLRKLGLINKVDASGKRILTPTFQGEIIFYYWRREHNVQNLAVDWNNHNICMKDANFNVFYSILNLVRKIGQPAILREIEDFHQFKLSNDAVNKVQNFLKDIEYFLETAVLTEKGVYLKGKDSSTI